MQEDFINGKSIEIASQLDLVDGVREQFTTFLRNSAISEREVYFWKLAMSEAMVNAIVHGNRSDSNIPVRVTWYLRGNTVGLEVYDSGGGPPLNTERERKLPDNPLEEHGRGLYLIKEFCDRIEHWRGDDGYRVVMTKTYEAVESVASDIVLEQALNELSACYENLAAFYRLGDGLVRSEKVSHFVEQALGDLLKVVACDRIQLSLTETLQPSLLDDLKGLPRVRTEVAEFGLESDAYLNKEEFIWETLEEIRGDSELASYPCGFCCPVQAAGKIQGVITIARQGVAQYFNSSELNNVRTFADLIGIAVANANNTIVRGREAQAYRELEIASQMQDNLLPIPQVPPHERWQVFVQRKSARDVAGDYVEIKEAKDGYLYLVTVDVMGKGISAAFLAAMFRTALHITMAHAYTLEALIRTLNRVLLGQLGDMTMFATCGIAKIHPEFKRIEMVNAGHCPLIVSVPGRDALIEVGPSGPPLGLFEDARYEKETYALQGGERVYMVTDGLYEWQCNGELWGWERFLEFVRAHAECGPEAFWNQLQTLIAQRRESGGEADDDQTFLYWELHSNE